MVYTDVTMVSGRHDLFVQVNHYFLNEIFVSTIENTLETNRCSMPKIRNFLDDPTATRGVQISSQRISVNPDEEDEALIGSYIVFVCKSGFQNTGNSLNVTCNADGQWSTFPSCQSTSTTATSSIQI